MCPKVTIVISEDTENELRDYIRDKYRKPFGKLSEVVEKSVQEYLNKEKKKDAKKSK
jgi:Arc/MetJ-type ribon-helix-helix transcriptional regulator